MNAEVLQERFNAGFEPATALADSGQGQAAACFPHRFQVRREAVGIGRREPGMDAEGTETTTAVSAGAAVLVVRHGEKICCRRRPRRRLSNGSCSRYSSRPALPDGVTS